MPTYNDILNMVSERKLPEPSKAFWREFDRDLALKLDAIDARRYDKGFSFAEKFKEALDLFLRSGFKLALAAASLMLIIACSAIFLAGKGSRLESVATLSYEELAGELAVIYQVSAESNDPVHSRNGTNRILNDLDFLHGS